MCATAMRAVNRYPAARRRTVRSRDLLNPTTRRPAVTKLLSATIESKTGIRGSIRGKGTRANGISRQNVANDAMTMASAHRVAVVGAGTIERNVLEWFDGLRSFIARIPAKLSGVFSESHNLLYSNSKKSRFIPACVISPSTDICANVTCYYLSFRARLEAFRDGAGNVALWCRPHTSRSIPSLRDRTILDRR
jgi:hypothetical protein